MVVVYLITKQNEQNMIKMTQNLIKILLNFVNYFLKIYY